MENRKTSRNEFADPTSSSLHNALPSGAFDGRKVEQGEAKESCAESDLPWIFHRDGLKLLAKYLHFREIQNLKLTCKELYCRVKEHLEVELEDINISSEEWLEYQDDSGYWKVANIAGKVTCHSKGGFIFPEGIEVLKIENILLTHDGKFGQTVEIKNNLILPKNLRILQISNLSKQIKHDLIKIDLNEFKELKTVKIRNQSTIQLVLPDNIETLELGKYDDTFLNSYSRLKKVKIGKFVGGGSTIKQPFPSGIEFLEVMEHVVINGSLIDLRIYKNLQSLKIHKMHLDVTSYVAQWCSSPFFGNHKIDEPLPSVKIQGMVEHKDQKYNFQSIILLPEGLIELEMDNNTDDLKVVFNLASSEQLKSVKISSFIESEREFLPKKIRTFEINAQYLEKDQKIDLREYEQLEVVKVIDPYNHYKENIILSEHSQAKLTIQRPPSQKIKFPPSTPRTSVTQETISKVKGEDSKGNESPSAESSFEGDFE